MSGYFDKIGNEKEKAFVVYQWLSLLLEDIDSVCWESVNDSDDERGVDLWYSRRGKRFAVQCKSKSTGHWTPSLLTRHGDRSILHSAVFHLLQRPVEYLASEFYFATDNQPDHCLSKLLADARKMSEASWSERVWSPEENKLLCSIREIEPALSESQIQCLFRRIALVPLQDREYLRVLAVSLVGPNNGQELLNALMGISEKQVLGQNLHKADLLSMLPKTLAENLNRYEGQVAPELLNRLNLFKTRAEALRRITPISRPEENVLWSAITSPEHLSILVHGHPGYGKSGVISAVAQKAWDQGWSVLALTADDIQDLPQFLSPERLKAYGGEKSLLILDQWDQMELSMHGSQRMKALCSIWVKRAKDLLMPVVIGCRTIDSSQDVQLRHILYGPDEPKEIAVELLNEEAVTTVLNDLHLPWADLSADMRKLVRHPVVLNLLQEMATDPNWAQRPHPSQVVNRWIDQVCKPDAQALVLLDRVVDLIERDGGFFTDESFFSDNPVSLDHLIKSGLILRIGPGRIQLSHQMIMDVRLATRLGGVSSYEELKEELGPYNNQTLHHARRLRQAVSIFCNRGRQGAELLGLIRHSSEIRPIVKRGLFLGVAECTQPEPVVINEVMEWFLASETPSEVTELIFRDNGDWMAIALEWVKHHPQRFAAKDADRLFILLGYVSKELGDEIADLLTQWAARFPKLNPEKRPDWVFQQDPLLDSDKLFSCRLAWQGLDEWLQGQEFLSFYNYTRLMEAFPHRALLLLGRYFLIADLESLCGYKDRDSRGIRSTLISPPEKATEWSDSFREEILSAWKGRTIPNLDDVFLGLKNIPPSIIAGIVDLMAKALAKQLDNQTTKLRDIFDCLPSLLRPQDSWLLLRIGCFLVANEENKENKETSDELAFWFSTDIHWASMRFGVFNAPWGFRFATEFIANLSNIWGHCAYTSVELRILDLSEGWNKDDEEYRWERYQKYGILIPNNRGRKTYRLLHYLPRSRWSPNAYKRYAELEHKFGSYEDYFRTNDSSRSGTVVSKIPTSKAQNFTACKWLNLFQEAADDDNDFWDRVQISEGKVGSSALPYLLYLFRELAEKDPQKFFPVAQSLVDSNQEFRPLVWERVLPAVASQPGEGPQCVPSEDICRLLIHPRILLNRDCERAFSQIIGKRADYEWPDMIIDRLFDIAASGIEEKCVTSRRDLLDLRYQRADCNALETLTKLAQKHLALKTRLFDAASILISRDDPPIVTEAIVAVGICFQESPEDTAQLIIDGCRFSECRTQSEVVDILQYLVVQLDESDDCLKTAIQYLLEMCTHEDDHISQWGAQSALFLLYHNLIKYEEFWIAVSQTDNSLSSITYHIAELLDDDKAKSWAEKTALSLANNDHAAVRKAIAFSLCHHAQQSVLGNRAFLEKLLTTKLANDENNHLFELFDETNSLTLYADSIITMVDQLIKKVRKDIESSRLYVHSRECSLAEGYLFRLIEECEKLSNFDLRNRALDSLDRSISVSPLFAKESLKTRTQ